MSEPSQHSAARGGRHRDDEADETRAAKLRRSGWLLGLLALGCYLGFIAWNLLRAPLGG